MGSEEREFDVSKLEGLKFKSLIMCREVEVNYEKPACLKIPAHLPEVKGLEKQSDDQIVRYFKEMSAYYTPMVNIDIVNQDSLCGHCNRPELTRSYYYCYDCCKNMCKECFKDGLEACMNHDIHPRVVRVYCLLCEHRCDQDSVYYDLDGVHGDGACSRCVEKGLIEAYLLAIKERIVTGISAEALSQRDIEEIDHFGSVLDWIPVYKDCDCAILYCANPENRFYKRCALTCGESCYTCPAKDTLSSLLEEYQMERSRYDECIEDCEKDADCEKTALDRMMVKRNMHVTGWCCSYPRVGF